MPRERPPYVVPRYAGISKKRQKTLIREIVRSSIRSEYTQLMIRKATLVENRMDILERLPNIPWANTVIKPNKKVPPPEIDEF